jgi:hypothetical protein
MAESREVKRLKAWRIYQAKIQAGLDDKTAERDALKEVFPHDGNRSRTLLRWKNSGAWPPESHTKVSEKVTPQKGDTRIIRKVIPKKPHGPVESPPSSVTEESPKSMTRKSRQGMTKELPDSMTEDASRGMTEELPSSMTDESTTEVLPNSMTISDEELTDKITMIVEQKLTEIFAARTEPED